MLIRDSTYTACAEWSLRPKLAAVFLLLLVIGVLSNLGHTSTSLAIYSFGRIAPQISIDLRPEIGFKSRNHDYYFTCWKITKKNKTIAETDYSKWANYFASEKRSVK